LPDCLKCRLNLIGEAGETGAGTTRSPRRSAAAVPVSRGRRVRRHRLLRRRSSS